MGVVHGAQVVAGPVKLWPQPDGVPELLHRLAHQLRSLMIRRHCGQLLQDQAPVVQRLYCQRMLKRCAIMQWQGLLAMDGLLTTWRVLCTPEMQSL